ncbi:MAG: biopolymer transporter ExbD [bacterium]|nr:biopolymer transporter ExbD [bacterium]
MLNINIRPPKRKKPENRLEIAPLLDVIFILLIFFAVSTTVIMNKGMKLQLPSAASVATQKKGSVLTIDREQRLYLNKILIPADLLSVKIADLVKEAPDFQIIVKADKYTPYSFLIYVLDNIRLGGCFDLVLEAKEKQIKEEAL